MHPHIKALRDALGELDIPFSDVEGFGDALIVSGQPFVRATTPFNTESTASFCRDKDAVYKALGSKVLVPKTRSFIDPQGSRQELAQAKSINEIVEKSLDFLYPRIVKMNKGEKSKNVFIAQDEVGARSSLEAIFDKSSRNYDYIALIQEYIEPAFEYRVAVAGGRPVFGYERKGFEIAAEKKFSELEALCAPVIETLGISWGAIDFIESKDGKFYFLEANTMPLYEGFIAKNGDARLRELYTIALSHTTHRELGTKTNP